MKKILKRIMKFNKDRDWDQFHSSKNLAISLNLEASEVLELFQWTEHGELPENAKQELKRELADTYYWLLLMAYKHKVNLNQALDEKMDENEKKYPVSKSKGKSTKYNKL